MLTVVSCGPSALRSATGFCPGLGKTEWRRCTPPGSAGQRGATQGNSTRYFSGEFTCWGVREDRGGLKETLGVSSLRGWVLIARNAVTGCFPEEVRLPQARGRMRVNVFEPGSTEECPGAPRKHGCYAAWTAVPKWRSTASRTSAPFGVSRSHLIRMSSAHRSCQSQPRLRTPRLSSKNMP